MIQDGDSAARNAFRVALLTAAPNETPLPVNVTMELDPGDILEVRDMAEAIARAEQIVAAPRSSSRVIARGSRRHQNVVSGGDLFESLGRRTTDDTAGPATPAPAPLSVIPSALSGSPNAGDTMLMPAQPGYVAPVLARPADERPAYTRPPVSEMILSLPAPSPEDDAYFQPAPRIRSLADATLDGYRAEPTLLLRAARRRKSFAWVLVAIAVPLAALAGFALVGRQEPATAATATTTIANATPVTPPTPVIATARAAVVGKAAAVPAAPVPTAAVTTAAAPKPIATMSTTATIPVFDVNSLPAAGARSTKHR